MRYLILITAGLLTACSSSEKIIVENQEIEIQQDKTISSLNDESRPSWLEDMLEQSFLVKDGYVYALGSTEADATSSRLNILYRVSRNRARIELATVINTRLTSVFSNTEKGFDSSSVEQVSQEIVKQTLSGATPYKNYHEKVAISDGYGSQKLVYKVFASIRMKESQFKAQTLKALKDAEEQKKLMRGAASKVNEEWSTFVSERQPANEEL